MTRHRESRRKWWVIAAVVIGFHLALLLFVRPEYFHFLMRDLHSPSGSLRSAAPGFPDAIIAIQVDVEDSETDIPDEPVAEESRPVPPSPVSRNHEGADGTDANEAVDIGDILGNAAEPRAGGGNRIGETVPPRPVEITWPETRRLKHCIGRHVDVRILVAADGRIREVIPQHPDIPADCLDAAMEAARRIKFTPGRVDGKPTELWAQVRIDFEEKR